MGFSSYLDTGAASPEVRAKAGGERDNPVVHRSALVNLRFAILLESEKEQEGRVI